MVGTSYYRRTIYMNRKPWENNREDTWTKYKGRVAKWPSGHVKGRYDHMIIRISGQG